MKKTITIIFAVVFMQVAAIVVGDMLDLQPAERATAARSTTNALILPYDPVEFNSALQAEATGTCTLRRGVESKYLHLEAWYRDKLAEAVYGATEVHCYLGRIDVATATRVYEVDKLEKHHECLGQALWYGWATKRKPAMALIVPFGEWSKFCRIKAFVESNSTVQVIALDESTGNIMATFNSAGNVVLPECAAVPYPAFKIEVAQ